MPIDTAMPMVEEPETVAPVVEQKDDEEKDPVDPKDFKARITKCKRYKADVGPDWATNVDYRRGKQFESDSDQDRVAVNVDWPQTKAKQAALFSQVPTVSATAKLKLYREASAPYAKQLNEEIKRAKFGVALDECLPDVINAAGIAGYMVGWETRSKAKQLPVQDLSALAPDMVAEMQAAGSIQMEEGIPDITDKRFFARRVSPWDLLWEMDFSGSDFDESPWVGRSGKMQKAEAKHTFRLTDKQLEEAAKGDNRTTQEKPNDDPAREDGSDEDMISYDEIFYWDYRYNPDQEHFKCIKHLVFVEGIDEPVIHEKWKGQKYDETTGKYTGACRFPVRIGTLTYITDEAVPPSDSAVGRPQVDELIRSRSQMIMQRERSMPIRGFDVNRVPLEAQANLMRGIWQAMIPINGNGEKAFWEIARANYPSEQYEFDRVAKADLQETWQVGANQSGSFASGERSAREADIVQSNFQTRIGYERARMAELFLGGVDVLAGLMALYGDFDVLDQEELQKLETWDRSQVNQLFAFTIRPDSTVLLDSQQRIDRLTKTLNITGQSGFINPEPIIREIIELSGLDPAEVMTKPNPKPADQPSITMRFSGAEILNPIVLAMLVQSGQGPSPEAMEAAKKMLASVGLPPGGLPLADPNAQPEPGADGESAPPTPPLDGGNPDWQSMPRVQKREPDEFGG